VPGCGESLRVRGRAAISSDRSLALSLAVDGLLPRTIIIVTVDSVYFHCAKAIHRSKLWDANQHVERRELPSVNAMLAAVQWRRCLDVVQPGRPAEIAEIKTDS
jgi:uncharacterized protein